MMFRSKLIRQLFFQFNTIKQIQNVNNTSVNSRVKSCSHFIGKPYSFRISRQFSSDSNDSQDKTNDKEEKDKILKPSIRSQFVEFRDEDAKVIFDVDEEMLKVKDVAEEEEVFLFQEKKKKKIDYSLMKRGEKGVFDIHELVDMLRNERVKNIAVIQVPEHLRYTDYMVLGDAKSKRHMKALTEFIRKVYKNKKSPSDPACNFGGEFCDDWKVLDIQNIVLHLFLPETRQIYDIETLWTVGHEFDDKTQKPQIDPVIDIMEKHIQFLEDLQPAQ